jgi:Spy/CpxP family protein refolding chaperone
MQPFKNKLAAWTAVATLGAASLFAAQTSPRPGFRYGHHGRMGAFLGSYLNLTDAQKTQVKTIFQDARQSSQPVRQQLQQTRQSLRAAVQSNDAAQIQQLSTTEGAQVGQLTAIRSTAFAKAYQVLTPDQQQKVAALQQARKAGRHQHGGAGQAPAPSPQN